MTRIFVDTRSYRGCWVAAHVAGLCDLDVVAFVAREAPPRRALNQMRMALERTSSVSRMSTVEIPCNTIDAVGIVRNQAGTNDIVVTDSAPFALEFLQAGGEATDFFGEVFTRENIDVKVRHFHACKELVRQGVNPYRSRPYRNADRERLAKTMEQLIYSVCSVTPRNDPIDFPKGLVSQPTVEPLSLSGFERRPDARVFVDGDACPQLPVILEVCSSARVPVVFVSNREHEHVTRAVRRAAPWLELGNGEKLKLSIKRVPMEKNAADRYIEQHILQGEIVLTEDTALMAACVNKGALAIDYRGRALGRPPGCDRLGISDVKLMRAQSSRGRKKKTRAKAFRSTLLQAVA